MKTDIKFKEKIAYGLGDFGNNTIYGMTISYLTIFYTDVFGLSTKIFTYLMIALCVVGIIFDPLMSLLIDKTDTKKGRFRPWMKWTVVPLSILAVLCFTTPNFGPVGKTIYAFITLIVMNMVYTSFNTPYSALASVVTRDPRQRVSIASIKNSMASLGALMVMVVTPLLTSKGTWFYENIGANSPQKSFQYAMIIFVSLGLLAYLASYLFTTEKVTLPKKEKTDFKKLREVTLKNKNYIIIIFCAISFVSVMTLRNSGATYYFKYNLGKPSLASVYFLVNQCSIVLGMFIINFLDKHFKKRSLLLTGALGLILSNIILFFLPQSNYYLFLVMTSFSAIFIAFVLSLCWSIIASTIDYGEFKTGLRADAFMCALFCALQRVAGYTASIVCVQYLNSNGYVVNAIQTPEALSAIRMVAIVFPIICMLPALCSVFFDLEKDKQEKMAFEIAKRHTKNY